MSVDMVKRPAPVLRELTSAEKALAPFRHRVHPDRSQTPHGYYIWDAERVVKVTTTDHDGVTTTTEMEHSMLVIIVGTYLDQVVRESGTDSDVYLILSLALDSIVSDMETGASLADWSTMRKTVDRALNITGVHAALSTEWPLF